MAPAVTAWRDRLLGIDFGGTKMAVAVADRDGTILAAQRLATRAESGAEQALGRALDLAADMVARDGGRLVAAGIATPGAVRADGIDLAPNVPGWESLRLAAAVRKRFDDVEVEVCNDLNAAALAELRLGRLRDADPGLVLGIGTGTAAAVTVGGTVLSGRHGAAGEIGYAITGAGWRVPGPALEQVFSGRALDELARTFGLADAAELCAAAEEPGAPRDALTERVDELARHLVTCCLLIDPQRIVLVGGVAGSRLVREMLSNRLAHALPYRPEVVLSDFPNDASLLGAVTLAAEAARAVPSG